MPLKERLVLRTVCWCAGNEVRRHWCAEILLVRGSGDLFLFRDYLVGHWCAEISLVLLEISWCRWNKHWCRWQIAGARIRRLVFIQGLSNVTLVCGNFTGAARNQNVGVDGINTGVAGRLLVR